MVSTPIPLSDVGPPKPPKLTSPPVVPPFIAPLVIPQSSPALSIAKSLKLSSLFWVHPTVRRGLKSGGDESPQTTHKKRPRPVSLIVPTRGSMDETILQRPKVVRNSSSPTLAGGRPKPETERDLRYDLSRIKRAGTACIVCCLDDTEMQTLGVTWTEYVQTANELSLDVLRIPIPEGLAPMDPAVLDSHLTKLIGTYTLQGDAILVHCRGGLGRAGLIACCWMLKLGLCGWMSERPPPPVNHDASAGSPASRETSAEQAPRGEEVDGETMRLVERLITVVRRRRSVKAVETYEQVKFLVEYVQFLRDQAASRTSCSGDLFASWDAQVD
uniref:Chitin synthase 7 ) n=1 Tax=Ganoderma boninense TaxID=34458 RepID=A0A5K1JY68_9APHY|nr:Chitin synthase 7 (EC (Chitin-UDP acetyl-glucosaminyl transferase 7) [Ganoderma boninense]